MTSFICVVLIYFAFEAGLIYIIVSVALAAVNLIIYSDFKYMQNIEQERQRFSETIQQMTALQHYMANYHLNMPPAPHASSGSEGDDDVERPPLAQYEIVPNIV